MSLISIVVFLSILEKRDKQTHFSAHISNHLMRIMGKIGKLEDVLMHTHKFVVKSEEFPNLFLSQFMGNETPYEGFFDIAQLTISEPSSWSIGRTIP